MTEKMDIGGMAKAMHQKQVAARQDGGPGSGPKKGGGGKKPVDLDQFQPGTKILHKGKEEIVRNVHGSGSDRKFTHTGSEGKKVSLSNKNIL